MDAFARALLITQEILDHSDYLKIRSNRYATFKEKSGKAFEKGKLSLSDLAKIAQKNGEPKQRSGQQELLENIINQYI